MSIRLDLVAAVLVQLALAAPVSGCAEHASPPQTGAVPLAEIARAGLPGDARVIEVAQLDATPHPNRALVLWMIAPEEIPFYGEPDEPYTCPDETEGSHYRGPTRVSLLDTARHRILNTVAIEDPVLGDDGLSIPYRIRPGFYYAVQEPLDEKREGRATILSLVDLNGDGKPHELVLYLKLNCAVVWTTLVGYSETRDQVLQYPVILTTENGDKHARETVDWVDGLFAETPARPGRWEYDLDFTGRGGCLDRYEVDYDPAHETFTGRKVLLECPEE
jgi:hypothetical protein